MKLGVNFLGTGSAFSKSYGNNSAVFTFDNGSTTKNLMVDCGRTTPDDLNNSKFTWSDIDAIFITHLHGDHVYGLEEAGFVGRFVLNRKPHLILPHEKFKKDLWDKILKGTMMNADLDRNMTLEDYFTYEIVDSEYFFFNDCMVSVYSTEHVRNKKSYGLIFGEEDAVVYTSDSLLNKEFVVAMEQYGMQALFHDCQFGHFEGRIHASLDDIETLPDKIKNKTFLMHYNDNLGDFYTRIKSSGLNIATRNITYEYNID